MGSTRRSTCAGRGCTSCFARMAIALSAGAAASAVSPTGCARLSQSLRDDFRASGLYHLLAVSGQNVAYVILGLLVVAWFLGLPRWAGHVAALGGVAGYVLAVGWQPSAVRAAVAGGI